MSHVPRRDARASDVGRGTWDVDIRIPAGEPWSSAVAVAERLIAAGSETYLVGGCVRDLLLGRAVKDVDVATAAHPEQVEAVFAAIGWKTIAVGRAFGVVVVVAPSGLNVEVATFRNDGQYVDGRRPSAVSFSTAAEDVARRDFTINALLLDLRDGRVVDHVGGLADLQARVLRAVGDAAARLREDRLRVLRALRFAAHLGLTIAPATWAAIQATELTGLSAERLVQEWDKGLGGPRRGAWFGLVVASTRMAEFCPPVAALDANGHETTARRLDALADDDAPDVRAAVWLSATPPAAATAWLDAQPLPRERIARIGWLLTHAAAGEALLALPAARRWRTLRAGWPAELGRVMGIVGAPVAATLAAWACDPRADRAWKPFLRAADLLPLGFAPGPGLGQALARLEDEQLEGRLADREAALALARTLPR